VKTEAFRMKAQVFWGGVALAVGLSVAAQAQVRPQAAADVARGRYLVVYGDCNSCHTQGWLESDGTMPVAQWLTGNSIGFRGPWGTVYPSNLRTRFAQITEEQWLFMIKTRGGHPPMKWTNLRVLTLNDQRAIYRFIRSLGAAGGTVPDDVPPGLTPKTPFYDVRPQTPPGAK
jgi:mono/diheme cytochrome c family protein